MATRSNDFGGLRANSARKMCFILLSLLAMLCMAVTAPAQDTGSISGTVTDKSGAAIVGAEVSISDLGGSLTRSTVTNSDGLYVVPALPGSTYNIHVTAPGFQKYEAKNVVLQVAQKARVDVSLTVGAVSEEVVVEGEGLAQVDTQSSELGGTINGSQITQLQLNGRNFVQLATIVPGVSNQTQQDEGQVGVNGSVAFSFNGGRTEYNNWELDGGDNMDNGSNSTLNVYPSIDAIAEVKVLTSNYGAQYGRNASGTVEVETKSGTNKFHGDVYYFGRNDVFNARNFFDPADAKPKFKKHDFGYTIGGPVFIPRHYNTDKQKTFFFFSEEWRRDLVPGQSFLAGVPSVAERGGDFSDVCPNPGAPVGHEMDDCPTDPRTAAKFNGSLGPLPIDPNGAALLVEIPVPNAPAALCGKGVVACFNSSPAQETHWREELVRVDHNFSSNERLTVRYIHDSWSTVTATTLWGCSDGCSFPTIQTNFIGPGTSTVARLTSTLTPTLLNEFVASYTADHITLSNTGPGAAARPASMTIPGLFPDFGNKLPGFLVTGNSTAYKDTFKEDNAFIPWTNSNPTYTMRDNMTKVLGKHSVQFGVYVAIAQKNEQSSFGSVQGFLNFDASNAGISTGNAFADLLVGQISSYQQVNSQPKYYFRYQIAEPYLQDDWRITPRLTLNLGVRVSLFGTYKEKTNQTFNFEPGLYNAANAPAISGVDGSLIDPVTSAQLDFNDPRVYNGITQCGGAGSSLTPAARSSCVQPHLFNPAPRIGFAWDPWGNGKTSFRGGYGMFFEHGNGNEQNVEALEATAPLVLNPSQPNISGYTSIGGGSGALEAFPLGFNSISTQAGFPYVQQWNLDVEHELPEHIVATVAYVGSKGTHLGLRREQNQIPGVSAANNPYAPGEAIGPNDCTTFTTPSGVPVTGQAANNLAIACGADPNPSRPFVGFSNVNGLSFSANSSYNAFQFSARRSIAPLVLSVAYTYSHSIDDASDGGAFSASSSFIDAYDFQRARASSNFDERHILNMSWVYDLPLFRHNTGMTHTLLGGWQYAGVMSIQTGTPFNVVWSGISDNAGVGNGQSDGQYVDLVGNPHSSVPSSATGPGPLLFNPNAFAVPRGLTFGDLGRNVLNNPRTTNFNMSLLKAFKFNETTGIEFRAEGFNIFNHTQWSGVDNDLASGTFLHPNAAHRARTMQFGLKFLF